MTEGKTITPPEYKSRLIFSGGYLTIDHPMKRPCWWFRLWHKVLLDITWKNLTQQPKKEGE